MNTTTLFSIVKKHINEYDYRSLLAGGAPDDEFDSESQKISEQISALNTQEEIALIIATVFSKSFGTAETAEDYLPLAQKIKKDISCKNP